MTNLGFQKAIPLLFLIAVGFCLKSRLSSPLEVGALKTLIVNVVLPATILLSVLTIDVAADLISLPLFALSINVYLLGVACLLARLLIPATAKSSARSLILMFPSLAPGLTAYPLVVEFLGESGLAWASLADMGNKLFVLLGLYVLALYWQQRTLTTAASNFPWRMIVAALFSEPANLAMMIGLGLVVSHITAADLPGWLIEALQKLSVCTTPLTLLFIGLSLKLRSSRLKEIMIALLVRSGAGFWLSAAAILLHHVYPGFLSGVQSPQTTLLLVIFPQVGCSLWPFLYASQINASTIHHSSPVFDTELALGLLTTSIPVSITIVLTLLTNASFFVSPGNLSGVGAGLMLAAVLLGLLANLNKFRFLKMLQERLKIEG